MRRSVSRYLTPSYFLPTSSPYRNQPNFLLWMSFFLVSVRSAWYTCPSLWARSRSHWADEVAPVQSPVWRYSRAPLGSILVVGSHMGDVNASDFADNVDNVWCIALGGDSHCVLRNASTQPYIVQSPGGHCCHELTWKDPGPGRGECRGDQCRRSM